MKRSIRKWHGQCMRKKKLRPETADRVVARAASEGTKLRSYYCPHCFSHHVTKLESYEKEI